MGSRVAHISIAAAVVSLLSIMSIAFIAHHKFKSLERPDFLEIEEEDLGLDDQLKSRQDASGARALSGASLTGTRDPLVNHPAVDHLFDLIDSNRDGFITSSEFSPWQWVVRSMVWPGATQPTAPVPMVTGSLHQEPVAFSTEHVHPGVTFQASMIANLHEPGALAHH